MKIVLFGANGTIGQRIAREALERGHEVTAIVRDPARSSFSEQPNLKLVSCDVRNSEAVAQTVAGHDVVVSALGPVHGEDPASLVDLTRSLIAGVERSGVRRLVAVGGAGSLEVAPGVQLMDTPEFPAAWKGIAGAHGEALKVCRENTTLDWTNISPAAFIAPGERTGKYRTGSNNLVTDDKGESRISAEDFAVAVLDEIEHPQHIRERFTAAY